jgi:hypothetical protein
MAKKTKSEWLQIVDQHRSGKAVAEILQENPDLKRTTLMYHIRKDSKIQTQNQDQDQEEPQTQEQSEPEPQTQTQPQPQTQTQAPAPAQAQTQDLIADTFLDSLLPTQPLQQSKPLMPSSDLTGGLFDPDDLVEIFHPDTLAKPEPKPEPKSKSKSSNLIGKSKSWWLSAPKKPPTEKEKVLEEDNEQLCLVQKIRLYFVHFPELSKLHIVPKKKNSTEPDTEKFLISLYTKKTLELEKILNFVRFHTRNSLNENSSIKVASNVLETGVKILELTLVTVGVQAQGLSRDVVADPDIVRCLKEILIDSSITSLNIGPKTDLAIKIGMRIVQQDSQNRIETRMKEVEDVKSRIKAKVAEDKPKSKVSVSLEEKYSDL